jgi:hypothetical protein
MFSIFVVVKSRQTVIMRFSKRWFLALAAFFIIIHFVGLFNNMQIMVMGYPTTTRMSLYLWLYFLKVIISMIFLSLVFVLPGIAGELLRKEAFPENKYGSFLHYLRSSFYTRSMTKAIIFGYQIFFIMLGLQALIFYLGQRYLGVWKEWFNFAQLSSAYVPFLSAFVLGSTAGLLEEIIYRLFGISLMKKIVKNTVLAVILVAFIWGFSHSRYAIFPVWFRGIEVSMLGILLGFIFVRYGLIPLIVAHYLFDVFWNAVAYLFGHSPGYLFIGSLSILALPLMFAIVAYVINREEKESQIKIALNAIEKFNLEVLITFISAKKSQGADAKIIKEELIRNNWDITLVDLALGEVFKN